MTTTSKFNFRRETLIKLFLVLFEGLLFNTDGRQYKQVIKT